MTRAFYSIVYDIVFLIERKINYFIYLSIYLFIFNGEICILVSTYFLHIYFSFLPLVIPVFVARLDPDPPDQNDFGLFRSGEYYSGSGADQPEMFGSGSGSLHY